MAASYTYHKDSYIAFLHARDLAERIHTLHFLFCQDDDLYFTRSYLEAALRECGVLNQDLDALLADLNAERDAA